MDNVNILKEKILQMTATVVGTARMCVRVLCGDDEYEEEDMVGEVVLGRCENSCRVILAGYQRKGFSKITIVRMVILIKADCFKDCCNLRAVVFEEPSRLEEIGNSAFQGTLLESIKIPRFVRKIGECAFSECRELVVVVFEEGSQCQVLDDEAFSSTGIPEFTCPGLVERIGNQCFYDCQSLVEFGFEEDCKLEEIGNEAFYRTKIALIVIPKNVEKIGDKCFHSCGSLVEIEDSCEAPVIGLRSIEFEPDSQLRFIGDQAFEYSDISAITIPKKVEQIGHMCFGNCSKLYKVTVKGCPQREKDGFTGASVRDVCCLKGGRQMLRDIFPEGVRFTEIGDDENCQENINF
jgi:hypothetical protein